MKRALAIAVCGLVAACAHRPVYVATVMEPVATAQEKDAAGAQWRQCLLAQEPKYDDMLSDAGTVARTLGADCDDQFNRFMGVMTQGEAPFKVRALVDAEPQARYDMALRVVLVVRAKHAKP